MSAYAAPIEVVQAALHRCGEESIASLDEGTPAALVATSNYEGIVRANLTRHAWDFATQTFTLALEGAITEGDFVWSWIIPIEAINVRWVLCGGRRLRRGEYRIEGRRILTVSDFSTSAPQIVANVRASEGVWADDFAEAMITRLTALFTGALAEKWQDARLIAKDAEAQFRSAIVRDKRQSPGFTQEYNALAEAWRSRGGRNHYLG